ESVQEQIDTRRVFERSDVQYQTIQRPKADAHLDMADVERRFPFVGHTSFHWESVQASFFNAKLDSRTLTEPAGRQDASSRADGCALGVFDFQREITRRGSAAPRRFQRA